MDFPSPTPSRDRSPRPLGWVITSGGEVVGLGIGFGGDGFLAQEELYRMIAVSLAESEVAERASQPADPLRHESPFHAVRRATHARRANEARIR